MFMAGPAKGAISIAATGTEITSWQGNNDDGYSEVTLPFTFPWYGSSESILHIGTNGYLTFGANAALWSSQQFPAPTNVDGVIGVFWTDINPGVSSEGGVFHQAFGDSSFVVEWDNVRYYSNGNVDQTTNSFQASLFAAGGVLLSYLDMDPTDVDTSSVESIGYESQDGGSGVQITYNEIPTSGTAYYIPAVCHSGERECGW